MNIDSIMSFFSLQRGKRRTNTITIFFSRELQYSTIPTFYFKLCAIPLIFFPRTVCCMYINPVVKKTQKLLRQKNNELHAIRSSGW